MLQFSDLQQARKLTDEALRGAVSDRGRSDDWLAAVANCIRTEREIAAELAPTHLTDPSQLRLTI